MYHVVYSTEEMSLQQIRTILLATQIILSNFFGEEWQYHSSLSRTNSTNCSSTSTQVTVISNLDRGLFCVVHYNYSTEEIFLPQSRKVLVGVW